MSWDELPSKLYKVMYSSLIWRWSSWYGIPGFFLHWTCLWILCTVSISFYNLKCYETYCELERITPCCLFWLKCFRKGRHICQPTPLGKYHFGLFPLPMPALLDRLFSIWLHFLIWLKVSSAPRLQLAPTPQSPSSSGVVCGGRGGGGCIWFYSHGLSEWG